MKYHAFVDMAEGSRSGDAAALAVAHREGSRAVLDLLRVVEPPFDPVAVVASFADVLHAYGCRGVTGDRHAVGFVTNAFAAAGITFTPSTLSKSDLYAELLPLINTGMVELLDHPQLRTQLLSLERRSVRGAKDSIDHPRGGHDDVANACAGALCLVIGVGTKAARRIVFSTEGYRFDTAAGGRTPGQLMADLIARTKKRAEAEARRDYELARRDAHEPMRSATVPASWRIGGKT